MAVFDPTDTNALLAERQRLNRALAEARNAPNFIKQIDQVLAVGATTGSVVRDNLIALGCYDLDKIMLIEHYLEELAQVTDYVMSVETRVTSDLFSVEPKRTEESIVIWRPIKPGFTPSGVRAVDVKGINLGVQREQPCATFRVIDSDWAQTQPEITRSQHGCTATTVDPEELVDLASTHNRHVTQRSETAVAWHTVLMTPAQITAWINGHHRKNEVWVAFNKATEMLRDAMLN